MNTKPRTRPATSAEVAKYDVALAPLLALPVGEARTAAILRLRERMKLYPNFAHGHRTVRAIVRH